MMKNNKLKVLVASMGATLLITGCTNLAPEETSVEKNIPDSWYKNNEGESSNSIGSVDEWRKVIKDENLVRIIEGTLENNKNLKISLLEVEKIKLRYNISESNRSFDIDGVLSASKGERGNQGTTEEWKAVGSVGYEIDIFNKARNLSDAAWQQYLSQGYEFENAKSEIISEVVRTYLDYLAEKKWLELSMNTLEARSKSYQISQKKNELGQVSDLDLAREEGLVEFARREVAKHQGNIDKNYQALNVFLNGNIEEYQLYGDWGEILNDYIEVTKNLSSDVLLNRPDIKAIESEMLSANANIGVARASRFPSIRITGEAGTISPEFSDLMSSGTGVWGISPSINIPIFNAGRLKTEVEIAEIEKEQLLNKYESSIQESFSEVSNIITDYEVLVKQKEAIDREVSAARKAYKLSRIRYDAGRDDYISFLDTERTLYDAEKESISIKLAQQKVLISLYRALGGTSN